MLKLGKLDWMNTLYIFEMLNEKIKLLWGDSGRNSSNG